MMAPLTHKNPFVGLRAFEENEEDIFFGRDKEISDLIRRFGKTRFLAVIGSSGSGKSSLVKSGLLPAIHSGFLAAGTNWHVALFRPGNDPIGEMTRALAKDGVLYKDAAGQKTPPEAIIDSSLRRSSQGLIQAYDQAFNKPELRGTEKLLIVIDQFEELFRYRQYENRLSEANSDSKHFVDLLLASTAQVECPIYVLITMRSDFFGDCADFRGLPEAINEGQYLVPRMTRDEIREAIKGPIAVGDATITPRLVTRILNDIGNDIDQLPIMQHAMMRTWESWRGKNDPETPIDLDDYEKIGGMRAALDNHANEAYAELSPAQQSTCEVMFKALTDKAADVRGIRRPRSINDIATLTGGGTDQAIQVVEVFRQPGRTFLMPPPGVPLSDASIIDISHESLMRVWGRLKLWTEEESDSAKNYMRLAEYARLHRKKEKDLLSGSELNILFQWYTKSKPLEVWAQRYDPEYRESMAYLLESQALHDRQEHNKLMRKRVRQFALAALFLVVLPLLTFYYICKDQNDHFAESIQDIERQMEFTTKNLAEYPKMMGFDPTLAFQYERSTLDGMDSIGLHLRKLDSSRKSSINYLLVKDKDSLIKGLQDKFDTTMHASLRMKDYLVGMYLDTNFYNSLFKSVRPENPRADDRMTAIRPFFVNEIFPKENGFRIWDAPKETIDNILKRDSVYSMVFPTEGMVSMVNYRNGTVGYWDSLSRFWPVVSNPYSNAIPMAPVYYMLFKYKILAAMDGKVYEWNLHSTERHFYTDDGLGNKIVSIAINKNRTRIFTASSDGKGKIWTANQNGHDFTESKPLPFNLGRDIMSSSAFSHSDSMIVTGFSNGRVKLWAASDGALLQEMNGHSPQSVNSVAFSPDDAFVYTGSLDGTYRRWQVKHKGVHGAIQETTPEQRSRLFDDLFKYGIIDKMATAADTSTGTKK